MLTTRTGLKKRTIAWGCNKDWFRKFAKTANLSSSQTSRLQTNLECSVNFTKTCSKSFVWLFSSPNFWLTFFQFFSATLVVLNWGLDWKTLFILKNIQIEEYKFDHELTSWDARSLFSFPLWNEIFVANPFSWFHFFAWFEQFYICWTKRTIALIFQRLWRHFPKASDLLLLSNFSMMDFYVQCIVPKIRRNFFSLCKWNFWILDAIWIW